MGNVNGDWGNMRDYFYHPFSPLSLTHSTWSDILAFEQLEKESVGATWARFSLLLASSLGLSIPDDVSLDIFCIGLD
jgi:hypothetical protein